MLEYKSIPFEVKADLSSNEFEGYASTFGNEDSYKDIMMPGAFKKTIKENRNRVKVLWQHDIHSPIGKPIHMEEDSTGLYVKARVSETSIGKDALILMRDGVIDEMSIGYSTIKELWDNAAGTRQLKEVKLYEFSPVTFAANEQAKVNGIKSAQAFLYQIGQELKSGNMDADVMKLMLELKTGIDNIVALQVKGKPPQGTDPEHDEAAMQGINDLISEMKTFAKGGK